MINFEFISSTKVIFGEGAQNKVGTEIKAFGGTKVLIHYDTDRIVDNGMLEEIHKNLEESGIQYVDLGGVVPNPRMALVKKGIEICRKEKVDFILAIGGGSVIDSSKAIAYGLAVDYDVEDLFRGKAITNVSYPVGVISTMAASGSETSNSCVITMEDGMLKRAYNHDCGRPKFAIMDPVLTYTIPPYPTACGAADIMMHTMERYFTNTKDVVLIDNMSEGLLRAVRDAAIVVRDNPKDYEARATLMWAGSISHNGLLGTGRVTDFATHKTEHELSGMFDVAHGAGITALWGSWARYVLDVNVNRFAQFAVNVFGVQPDYQDLRKTALLGIKAWEDWCRSIHMPINLKELGIDPTDEQIHEMAMKATSDDTVKIGGFLPLDASMIEDIIKAAR